MHHLFLVLHLCAVHLHVLHVIYQLHEKSVDLPFFAPQEVVQSVIRNSHVLHLAKNWTTQDLTEIGGMQGHTKNIVSELKRATTASAQHEIEKKYGVRNSELLRLPYFDVVNFHVVDPMHNLLLGTAKHSGKK